MNRAAQTDPNKHQAMMLCPGRARVASYRGGVVAENQASGLKVRQDTTSCAPAPVDHQFTVDDGRPPLLNDAAKRGTCSHMETCFARLGGSVRPALMRGGDRLAALINVACSRDLVDRGELVARGFNGLAGPGQAKPPPGCRRTGVLFSSLPLPQRAQGVERRNARGLNHAPPTHVKVMRFALCASRLPHGFRLAAQTS